VSHEHSKENDTKKGVTQRICRNAGHDSDVVNSRVMYIIYLRQLYQNSVLIKS